MKINVRESIRLPADENSRFRQVRHHDGQKVEKQRKENRMQGAMPISMATVGTAYTIKKISGNTEVRSHLKSMGFTEGTEVKVITQLDGDVIIHVKESRVAINKDQARHILV